MKKAHAKWLKQRRSSASEREKRIRMARTRAVAAVLVCTGIADSAAGPEGMVVREGSATSTTADGKLVLNVSDRSLLEWAKFNLNPSESVIFQQPNAASIVWNRIGDANPSQIFGRLEANGIVVLQNPAGFHFGKEAFVSAAGLFITTSPVLPADFAPGAAWMFSGPPPTARIVNYGELRTEKGGSLYLIAEQIENHGKIEAPEGRIGLLAGQEVLVSDRPDGRGLSASVKISSGIVDNYGKVLASAGEIALHASVVNQQGWLHANSIREKNGIIELVADQALNLGGASDVQARGDAIGASNGGVVTLKSGGSFSDQAGSKIGVQGGENGGHGGQVEISAPQMANVRSSIEGQAAPGWKGGSLWIDPTDIVISRAGDGQAPNGTVTSETSPGTLALNIDSSFVGFSQITLEATRDISLTAGTLWDLNESTGRSEPGSKLTLRAGRNIRLETGSSLVGGENWSFELMAGVDFATDRLPQAGSGSILLNGSASIEALNGSIGMIAGQDVTVQSGFIRTVGGGSISIEALAGSINTGTRREGYEFTGEGGYGVNLGALGGVSTGAGGDVTLKAGQDITSFLPTGSSSSPATGGSGAFGSQPGNVLLDAGRDVLGHFVLANGVGRINSGRSAGSKARQVALSLVKGSWAVKAELDILLQEVRNPNGIFNNRPFPSSGERHIFDYDPGASVSLEAGNSVQILAASLPRNSGESIPPIYPPTLLVAAGSGGIALGSDLYLYPSSTGQLEMETVAGGSLMSVRPGVVYELGMADTIRNRWESTASFRPFDRPKSLLHKDDLQPAKLTIDGSIADLSFFVPKPLLVESAGDVRNTSFRSQHFRVSDVTSLLIQGDIQNRNDWTFAYPNALPDFAVLFRAVLPPNSVINLASLRAKIVYNETLGRLGFQGRMSAGELAALTGLLQRKLDEYGAPMSDGAGEPLYEHADFVSQALLQDLFERSQDIPNNTPEGYQVSGPGRLEIRADNLDLGITEGIVSHGPGLNPLLGEFSFDGVDIDIVLRGSLSMFSSSIQSRSGGDIRVVADGSIDVGSQEILTGSESARGIYSSREGDVTIVAKNDINVNGSRIAAYSGGNVFVKSLEGSIDAGEGGSGFVRVERVEQDPETGGVVVRKRGLPGSGILATSFPDTPGSVGDILVESPRGDVRAGLGGIAQVSFNGTPNLDGQVTVVAGTPAQNGAPAVEGNIRAGNSGVIGGNISLKATGDIAGVVVAQGNVDIDSSRNINVTAMASGNVSVSAAGSVSGTIISSGAVDAQGGSIDASMISSQGASGTSANGASVATTDSVAPSASAQAAAATSDKAADAKTEEDDEAKKREKNTAIKLVRTRGRVTVLMP